LFGVCLVVACSAFSDIGRYFSIASLTSAPYLSILVNSICFFGIALFARGWFWPALVLTSLMINFHSVTGVLAATSVSLLSLLERRFRGDVLDNLKAVAKTAGITILCSIPAIYKFVSAYSELLKSRGSSGEQLVKYALHTSASPFPVSDGIQFVFAQVLAGIVAIFLLSNDPDSVGPRRLRAICFFVLVLYLTQLIGADVFGVPIVVQMVLHRLTPVMFACLASGFVYNIQRRFDKGELIQFAAIIVATCFSLLSGSLRLGFPNFVSESLLYLIIAVGVAGVSRRRLGVLCAVVLAMAVVVGIAPLTEYYSDNRDLRGDSFLPVYLETMTGLKAPPVAIVIVIFCALLTCGAPLSAMNRRVCERVNVARKRFPVMLRHALPVMLVLIGIGNYLKERDTFAFLMSRQRWTPIVQPFAEAELIDFLSRHSEPRDVVFVPFIADLNGFRRQFYDRKGQWYVLYSKRTLSDIIARAVSLGLDFESTSSAHRACGVIKRMFVVRCMQYRGLNHELLYSSEFWAQRVKHMVAAEPGFNLVVLRADDRIPQRETVETTLVAAEGKYKLLRLTGLSRIH
jgi:hypothetical protein